MRTITFAVTGASIPTVMVTAGLLFTAGSSAYPLTTAAAVSCKGVPATIVGTDGRDDITGTPGRDVIATGEGPDDIHARGGRDLVCAGPGIDYLWGGPGNDRLYGQQDGVVAGEDQYGDTLIGGSGNDRLDGGPGLRPGDRGQDVLAYPKAQKRLRLDLAEHTAVVGSRRDRVFSFEYVRGTPQADVLRGDRYFQFLSGFGGNDVLNGRGGPDFLFSDNGNDLVRGGSGDDILDGGAGTDEAYGGPNGNDGDSCRYFETEHGCED